MAIFLVPFVPPGGSGANGQVVYNSGGVFASESDLIYDPTTNLLTIGGDIRLNDGGSFTTTLATVTATANRTITFPDATGTVALMGGGASQLVYNNAGLYAGVNTLSFDGSVLTLSGRLINTFTSLASSPAKLFSGSWFSGGTATTTKPQVLVEPTGATSTAWSTSGTGFGVNAASGFTGRLVDLQINGTPRWHVNAAGVVVFTQPAPVAVNTSATLTIANIQAGIITSTTAAAVDMTLPTGTLMDGGFTSGFTDMAINWSVINTGPSAATLLVGASHTIIGSAVVAAGTSGRFTSRRTAATTWVTYRV